MKQQRARSELAIPITLDPQASTPLTQQLVTQFRQAIRDGRLPAGSPVPSTRHLATSLGVSRTVTATAYDHLLAEGYLIGRHGPEPMSVQILSCHLKPLFLHHLQHHAGSVLCLYNLLMKDLCWREPSPFVQG
nr:winged helix-turn-helix domain-containing protein [Dictyobacter vulcani]